MFVFSDFCRDGLRGMVSDLNCWLGDGWGWDVVVGFGVGIDLVRDNFLEWEWVLVSLICVI